jgi:transcription elongation factor Elf1
MISDEVKRALSKRGFKIDDSLYHDCPACGKHAMEQWVLRGKGGGRDIDMCNECGKSWSWRVRFGTDREEDKDFDLTTFLK